MHIERSSEHALCSIFGKLFFHYSNYFSLSFFLHVATKFVVLHAMLLH